MERDLIKVYIVREIRLMEYLIKPERYPVMHAQTQVRNEFLRIHTTLFALCKSRVHCEECEVVF